MAAGKGRGRPVQRVKQPDVSVAAVEGAVVKVVEVRLVVAGSDPREAVAGVVGLGAEAGSGDPHVHEKYVWAEEEEACGDGDEVGDNELDGVAVHGGQREWRRELVVDFVDVLVQHAVVQRPVHVVKKHLVQQEVRDKHPRTLGVRGQRAADAHAVVASRGDCDADGSDHEREPDQRE